uniref:39S ribosomal protein L1, mitochondrial n=1 Tax=Strigamia maritima TaxID=126957 RepID=T1IXS5_STRMM
MAAITSLFSSVKARSLTCASKVFLNLSIQQRNYAKRRGVKEIKAAKLRKTGTGVDAPVKKGVVVRSVKSRTYTVLSKLDKTIRMEDPVDNVFCFRNYKFLTYSIEEAMKMHTESHHPSIYSDPNAIVYAFLELDMTKQMFGCIYIQSSLPKRRPEEEEAAINAGAYLVVKPDYVKKIKKGEVPHDDFDYCVTTPDVIPEVVPIRGILNKKFPNQRKGTAGFDIGAMVKKLSHCIEYRIVGNPPEPQFAWLNVPIGKLGMSSNQIEENLTSLLDDVCSQKPAKLGPPIVRLLFLTCPPTDEKFLISHNKYVTVSEEDSDDEAQVKKQ